ncbi:hypothetical protein Q9L42_007505 [Methylomarinum sp. Ch1-1]|uniref:Uncharacterized protein n=1 Tax=Methylomarinum roseum TaxID=3067653 RepID=A0AAU7NYI0_9GAMM|nr:hypothetical protein [Methylomarinum sp. Ch1-1]MDP4521940.1 hypothetical protein [Methylomarinum sp. Ch1-1]
MGKASRRKKLKRQQAIALEKCGGIKLSEALINLCEPYDHEDLPLHAYENLMAAAAMAWNIALQPEEKRQEMLLDALNKLSPIQKNLEDEFNEFMNNPDPENPPDSIVLIQIITGLIKRKDTLYPNDNRVVVDYEITENATQRHVTVTSSLSPKGDPN